MIFYQILSTHSLWKCIEISLENLYVDTGAQRVEKILHKGKLHFLVSFSCETRLEVQQMTQNRYLKGTSLIKMQQSRNGALLINNVSTHYSVTYLNWGTWKKIVQSQKILKFFGKQTNKIQGSSKQPMETLKQVTLSVLLPKNLRIFCFQKSL